MIETNDNSLKFVNFKWEPLNLPLKDFKEKVEAMLIWWAIWDALWVPVEMKTHKYISENYVRLDKYLDSSKNIFFKKHWLEEWVSGLVSDDTVMTFAWVDSIIKASKIDFKTILEVSLDAYYTHPYWFWSWHRTAFEKYEELQKENPNAKNYLNLGSLDSAWNWVMMKQSPYRAYYSINSDKNNEEIDEELKIITQITHSHPTAIVASLVHNRFLTELIKTNKDLDFASLLDYLIKYSSDIEKEILSEKDDKISILLTSLLEDYNSGWLITYEEILQKYWWGEQKIWASGYVLTTMWIVYSLFLNKQNFDSLLDAVNIGWDTDTFAAIIWNMIWAYKSKFYSKEFENWLKDIETLKKKTSDFVKVLLEK